MLQSYPKTSVSINCVSKAFGFLSCYISQNKIAYSTLEKMKTRGHLEDLGVDTKIILAWILGKECGRMWTEYICLRIGTSGRLL
jgi:hypothetical protein